MPRCSNSRISRRAVSVEHFANFAYFDVERNPSNPFSIRLIGDVILLDDMGTNSHLTRVNGGQQVVAVGVRVPDVR